MKNINLTRSAVLLLCALSTLFLHACSPREQNETAQLTTEDDDSRQQIGLIIEGEYVVTMDGDGAVVSNGAVAVDDGVIIAIGTVAVLDRRRSPQ